VKLENKVAVVTGAGRGIGKAIATRLAGAGAKVVVNDIDLAYAENLADRLKKAGRQAFGIRADVAAWLEVAMMFKAAEKRYGGVDILVSNAGIRRDAPLHKMSDEHWDAALATQINGTFNCARAAQKHMVRQNYGRIINVSSPVPASLGERGQTAYASASAAVQGFTKALAVEIGRYGVTVNCICPDYVDTEMTRNTARKEGMYLDDFRRFASAHIPLRRLGTPDEVAGVALFLASDDASYVSGQIINVRGGP
jgi:3-oxoacyl-[acyl-carrier protein] reductase